MVYIKSGFKIVMFLVRNACSLWGGRIVALWRPEPRRVSAPAEMSVMGRVRSDGRDQHGVAKADEQSRMNMMLMIDKKQKCRCTYIPLPPSSLLVHTQ